MIMWYDLYDSSLARRTPEAGTELYANMVLRYESFRGQPICPCCQPPMSFSARVPTYILLKC